MTFNQVFTFFTYSSALSVLIPLGLFLKPGVFFKNKLLFLYLLLSLVADSYSYYLIKVLNQNNISLYAIFTCIELFLLGAIYFNQLLWRKLLPYWCLLGLLSVIMVGIFRSDTLLQVVSVASSVLLIGLSTFYFFKVFDEAVIPILTDFPFFWINSGILIGFGTSIFITIFLNLMLELPLFMTQFLWLIQLISNILMNFCFAIALWKMKPG